MSTTEPTQLEILLKEKFADAILQTRYNFSDLEVTIKKEEVTNFFSYLKNNAEMSFDYLRNITSVDYKNKLEIVYHLYSTKHKYSLIAKVNVETDNPVVDSVTPLWAGVNWQEREIFDMFGIKFNKHPDMRRILLPDEWEGYPLRKK